MRILFAVTCLAASIANAGCTSAPPATQVSSADGQTTQADPNARSCRSMVVTGSALPKRVCQTQAEWDAYDEAFGNSNESRKQERLTRQNSGQR